jgi:hypothetical protein
MISVFYSLITELLPLTNRQDGVAKFCTSVQRMNKFLVTSSDVVV